jgi:hypothetical protein
LIPPSGSRKPKPTSLSFSQDLPAESAIEYKFILINNDMEAVEWQPGENRIIATSAGATSVRGQWEEAPSESALEGTGAPEGTVPLEADVSEGESSDGGEEVSATVSEMSGDSREGPAGEERASADDDIITEEAAADVEQSGEVSMTKVVVRG